MKVQDAIARISLLCSTATGERATMLTLTPSDFEALQLAIVALGTGATCKHCSPALLFAAKFPAGVAPDNERNWDSMYPGAESLPPPAAELCPVCNGPLTPQQWCARCADPSIPPGTFEHVPEDCELCERERELEPGTFTPHEHGGGPWGRITVASEPPEVAQHFEQTQVQRFGVPVGVPVPVAMAQTQRSLPGRCRSERFANRVGDPGRCVLASGHTGAHTDGMGVVW